MDRPLPPSTETIPESGSVDKNYEVYNFCTDCKYLHIKEGCLGFDKSQTPYMYTEYKCWHDVVIKQTMNHVTGEISPQIVDNNKIVNCREVRKNNRYCYKFVSKHNRFIRLWYYYFGKGCRI